MSPNTVLALPIRMFLKFGKKLENLEEAHTNKGRKFRTMVVGLKTSLKTLVCIDMD